MIPIKLLCKPSPEKDVSRESGVLGTVPITRRGK